MELNEFKEKLKNLKKGNFIMYPESLPPQDVNNLIQKLGVGVDISEDWNGSDLDWSMDLTLNGEDFNVWGSGFTGKFCFKKK